jgi:hypothetical protein
MSFNKSSIVYLSRFGIIASALYCIPVIFFLKDQRYTDTWLLYLGSAIFLMCIFIFGIVYGGKIPSQTSKKYNGFIVTTLGVIFSCILILTLTLIFAPGVFNFGSSPDELLQTPAAIAKNNGHSLLFMMLADAIIINFCAGTFAAVMTRSKNEEKKLPANE